MAWTRLDDNLTFHPKVLAAGNAAVGVWTRALAYCACHATGGFVSADVARQLGNPKELEAVTKANLWRPVVAGEAYFITGRRDASGRRKRDDVELVMPGDGFWIPDFLHYHPTRTEAEELRDHRARAAKESHEARKSPATPHANGVQVQTKARASALQSGAPPDPTRPDLEKKEPNPEKQEQKQSRLQPTEPAPTASHSNNNDLEPIGDTAQHLLASLNPHDDGLPV